MAKRARTLLKSPRRGFAPTTLRSSFVEHVTSGRLKTSLLFPRNFSGGLESPSFDNYPNYFDKSSIFHLPQFVSLSKFDQTRYAYGISNSTTNHGDARWATGRTIDEVPTLPTNGNVDFPQIVSVLPRTTTTLDGKADRWSIKFLFYRRMVTVDFP